MALTFDEALEAFDGLMLGDGGLVRHGGGARYCMKQSKHTIPLSDHLKWLQWIVGNIFPPLGVVPSRGYPKITTRVCSAGIHKGELYQQADLVTHQSALLTELYNEWYANGEWVRAKRGDWYVRGARKVLPERLMEALVLPIRTLSLWFLGDGGSYKYFDILVDFSTHCFSTEEVSHLTCMLNSMGVATVKPERYNCGKGSGLVMKLSRTHDNTNHFMDLVEPTIMEIFGDSPSPSYKDMIKRR